LKIGFSNFLKVKAKFFSLFFTISFCTGISAQEFTGFVKKADTASTPIFQAKVEITEGDKPFKLLKTYFDGSFKFVPNKNKTYSIKITYSGYTDTSYTITTNKNANPSTQNVIVRIKKDGMRLMGVIKTGKKIFRLKARPLF